MVGYVESPAWLSTDALLMMLANNRQDAIKSYREFVQCGVGKNVWDNLQHQFFLGDNEFIEKYQSMLDEQTGDLSEIPLKQRSTLPQSLVQYELEANSKYEAIVEAYQSGDYTQKQVGEFFGLHYSQISRIVAKYKS